MGYASRLETSFVKRVPLLAHWIPHGPLVNVQNGKVLYSVRTNKLGNAEKFQGTRSGAFESWVGMRNEYRGWSWEMNAWKGGTGNKRGNGKPGEASRYKSFLGFKMENIHRGHGSYCRVVDNDLVDESKHEWTSCASLNCFKVWVVLNIVNGSWRTSWNTKVFIVGIMVTFFMMVCLFFFF